MIKMNKKGQAFENLQALIIPLIAIAIVLVVGFLIMAESKEQVIKQDSGLTDWCPNPTTLHGTYALVQTGSNVACCNSSGCLTSNDAVGGGNYTYNATTGVCCNVTGAGQNCASGNTIAAFGVTSCLAGNTTSARVSIGYNATEDTQKAMDDIPGWLPIIVITVIGAILIGLVAMFGSLRKQ